MERIGRLDLEENEAPPTNQPGSSWKVLKWVSKTLESVHPDEVGKMGTRCSTRQDDGRDTNNSNLGDVEDMDVS